MNALRAVGLCAALALPAAARHEPRPVPSADANSLVILDPGHGGEDRGAVVRGRVEADMALLMARKLRARLKDLPVALTRDEDRYVTLDRRVIESVDRGGSVFVSLHFDQTKDKSVSGAVVYSYGPDRRRKWRSNRLPLVPPMPAPPAVAALESEALANDVVRQLRRAGVNAVSAKADYYVLKNPLLPSVLVELGYLTNPAEAARLSDPRHQDALVEALARAIEGYVAQRSLRAFTASSDR